ncbi:MAG: radical SAM protein [Elusimicrobiales bacterium]|nr:radical SAM protein [Elusimicrobiales bacterium]
MSEKKVQGRSFTSNISKLLKHLDKLKILQEGGIPSPVMLHMSICNICTLNCSFCCFSNRKTSEVLSIEKIKQALTSFRKLGVKGLEFTGGGEPTLHPQFDEAVRFAYDLGFKIGICTNGRDLARVKTWDKFTWVRLGLYGWTEGYTYDLSVFKGLKAKITGAFVWDESIDTSYNPHVKGGFLDAGVTRKSLHSQRTEKFYEMIDWVEKNKIPTRIAINVIKPPEEAKKDMETVKALMVKLDTKYAFISDFNFKLGRRNDNCYMHMVKPFLFTDGKVYVCPSSELAIENKYKMNDEFMLCDIDGIEDFYKGGVTTRHHKCSYCKYAMQNELIDELLMEVEHNEFA